MTLSNTKQTTCVTLASCGQLQAREENWRVLAEMLPQLVWTTRADGWADYTNQRFCDYTHATPEQLQGYGWGQFLHPEDAERALAVRAHAFRTGIPYEVEYRLREGQTGCYRWFLVRGMPVRDDSGQIVRWFGTCTDIEEQKRTEHALRESREELVVLIETMPQLVWIARPDGFLEQSNRHTVAYLNVPLEQFNGDQWVQFVHPEDRDKTRTVWQTALRTGQSQEVEYRLREGKTGNYRWFLVRGTPFRDEQGHILKWFGTCTDIDEQKRAEQQLKASEENWRVLAETVPHLVWASLPDGSATYFNQRYSDYIGASPEHILGSEWQQFIHPDDSERTLAVRRHSLERGEPYEIEYRLRESQTGEYRWFLARAMSVRDETGQIIKWVGTCTDIDEQKRIEEALRESQERASVLMNSSFIGMNVIEGEQIVDANETFLRMTGYTREDLHAGRMNWLHMTASEDLARTRQAHQELATQHVLTPYEKAYLCQDGGRLPVLVGAVPLQHHPSQAIGFVLDNSARKELEQRKDAFISMASHELKTPLTALKLQTSLLHRQLARQGILDQAPALSSMETQIKTITRLVEELLDVSKIQVGRLEYVRETVDLNALLQEITETLQQTNPSHILVVHGMVGTSLIGDRDRLGQVFTNLLSNAIKYSPDAEKVEIDLRTSEEAVTISVRDHGLGIPREQRDKIFDRFYRASGPKQRAIPGLGMGLYIVAEIVKGHGGNITVDSTVGKGSTFTVTLPLMRDVVN